MTEMIKKTEIPEGRKIKPLAFLSSLALAPVSIGLPCLALALIISPNDPNEAEVAFALMVPFVAMFLGAPTYLTFGAFALHSALARGHASIWPFVRSGLLAHLVSTPLAVSIFALADLNSALQFSAGYFALGCIFAPLWSAIFAALYKRMS